MALNVQLKGVKVSAEYRALVPRPRPEEYAALRDDIARNGIVYPLVLNPERVLLDGHTRYDAAKELGIREVPVATRDFPSQLEERRFVITANVSHRQLTSWQVARLGLRLAEIEAELAARRMKATQIKDGKPPTGRQELGYPEGKALDLAGAAVGLSGETLRQARQVLEAAVDDREVARLVERADAGDPGLTVNALYEQMRLSARLHEANLRIPDPPGEEHDVLIADPPWEYDFSRSDSRAIGSHYPTMALDEIMAYPIHAARDAVLFLWVPMPKLREGLAVMEAWGFEYKTGMVWVKDKIGMGYYVRSKHELVLIGVRGDMPIPRPKDRPASVFAGRRKRHSEKPETLFRLVRRMYPGREPFELFPRTHGGLKK